MWPLIPKELLVLSYNSKCLGVPSQSVCIYLGWCLLGTMA